MVLKPRSVLSAKVTAPSGRLRKVLYNTEKRDGRYPVSLALMDVLLTLLVHATTKSHQDRCVCVCVCVCMCVCVCVCVCVVCGVPTLHARLIPGFEHNPKLFVPGHMAKRLQCPIRGSVEIFKKDHYCLVFIFAHLKASASLTSLSVCCLVHYAQFIQISV